MLNNHELRVTFNIATVIAAMLEEINDLRRLILEPATITPVNVKEWREQNLQRQPCENK